MSVVPSNSVSKELAEKIRNQYFPKKEVAPKRTIKVIKKERTTAPALEEMPVEAEVPALEIAAPPPVEQHKEEKTITPVLAPVIAEEAKPKIANRTFKLAKRVSPTEVETEVPAPEVEEAEVIEPIVEAAPVEETVEVVAPVEEAVETPVEAAPVEEAPPAADTTPAVAPRTGTQVKQLALNKKALDAGMKQGERVVAPQVPTPQKVEKTQPVGRAERPRPTEFTRWRQKTGISRNAGRNRHAEDRLYAAARHRAKQGRRGGAKKAGPSRRCERRRTL